MIKKSRSNIRKKLLFAMIGLIIILLILMSIFNIYSDRTFFQEGLDRRIKLIRGTMTEKGRALTEHVAINAEHAIATFNFFNLGLRMEELVRETEGLEYGILMDRLGVAYVHTTDRNLLSFKIDSESDKFALQQTEFTTQNTESKGIPCMEFIQPIMLGNDIWGVLRLGLSLSTLNAEIEESKLIMSKHLDGEVLKMIGIALFCSFLGIIMVAYISNRITLPLKYLTEFSENLANGNFSAKVPESVQNSNDETGVLSRTFVAMAKTLEVSYKQLKDQSRSLEQYSRKLVESQETERKRISAELHDSLAQNIMVVNNEIQKVIKNNSHKKAEDIDSLNLASSIALQSLNDIKGIAYDLRPPQLDQLGLEKAIKALASIISRSSGIKIYTKIDFKEGEKKIPTEIEIHIYRIIQEGLNNIVKHSIASAGKIELKSSSEYAYLKIEDDGKGLEDNLNYHKSDGLKGFGLQGIEERAKMFGGKMEIFSRIKEGTKLSIIIPLKDVKKTI